MINLYSLSEELHKSLHKMLFVLEGAEGMAAEAVKAA